MYTETFSSSRTDSFSNSRAKYVLGKVYDDFNGIIFRGFINVNDDNVISWRDDIAFVVSKDAMYHFELQFKYDGEEWVVSYEVDKYGGITRDDDSGGLDFYSIPSGASFGVVISYDTSNEEVNEYLKNKGWGTGGKFQAAGSSTSRSYSKDGFGMNRKLKGNW